MAMRRGTAAVLAWLAVASAAAGQPVLSDASLVVDTVLTQLSAPTTLAFLAADDFLFLEKNSGRVRRVVGGVLQAQPVLDVAVNADNERGLLGIAVNRAVPPQVFLYFTAVADAEGDGVPDGGTPLGNRVVRYAWNAGTARLENPQVILDLPVLSGPNHNGGVLVLGPTPTPGPTPPVGDGSALFVVIGDLNRGGQLENVAAGAAPDDTAVILRVLQDGSAAPGNPFVPYCSATTTQACPTGGGCPGGQVCRTAVSRYWAYGVRNSFGLAIDPVSGDLWDTENGPGSYDEINRVAPGFNSGWLPIMGPDARDPQGVSDLFAMPGGASAYSDPELAWLTPIAVTGLVFPSGGALGPAYDDVALVADFNNGQLYRLPLDDTRTGFDLSSVAGLADLVADSAAERDLLRLGSGFGGISDLERAPDGSIYVVSNGAGAIYRVRARNPPTPTPTVTATPTPFAVGGTVQFFAGNAPVPNVLISATGSAPVTASSGGDGSYQVAPLAAGDWTLTPRKLGGVNAGISTLDATYILQRVAGVRPFGPAQLLACDVTGNGSVSPLDAARILQLLVGDLTRLPAAEQCGSDFAFVPVAAAAANQEIEVPALDLAQCRPGAISYAPLVGQVAGQNFRAALIGDCNGDWEPGDPRGAPPQLAPEGTALVVSPLRRLRGGRWRVAVGLRSPQPVS
ncbi:MAG: PQQ-dependent sugar dehydrogenase, partial [Candidatus Binatia bacterium]